MCSFYIFLVNVSILTIEQLSNASYDFMSKMFHAQLLTGG